MHQTMWGTSFDFLALAVAINTATRNSDHEYLDGTNVPQEIRGQNEARHLEGIEADEREG